MPLGACFFLCLALFFVFAFIGLAEKAALKLFLMRLKDLILNPCSLCKTGHTGALDKLLFPFHSNKEDLSAPNQKARALPEAACRNTVCYFLVHLQTQAFPAEDR